MPDKTKLVDTAKHELEDATISRPEWARDLSNRNFGRTGTKAIPQSFLDAILEVIAKSIEQALADVMARCVGEGVERAIRPLAQEIALLRIAIDHDWDSPHRRRRSSPHDGEDFREVTCRSCYSSNSRNRRQEARSIAASHRTSCLSRRRTDSRASVQRRQSCLVWIRSCVPATGSHVMPDANRCQAAACHVGLHFGAILVLAAQPIVPLKMVFRFISIE